MKTSTRHNAPLAVIGGGIAGLACAEYLSRCGRRVVLAEAGDRLCGQSSASLHGWFHTGSLYAFLPEGKFTAYLLANLHLMLANYQGFPGLNIGRSPSGKLAVIDSAHGWFQRPIHYVVSRASARDFRADPDDGWRKRIDKAVMRSLGWPVALHGFRARQRALAESIWQAGDTHKSAPAPEAFGFDSAHHLSYSSFDCTMSSVEIARDLLKSFVATEGTVLLQHRLLSVESRPEGPRLTFTNGHQIQCEAAVLAMGAGLKKLFPRAAMTTIASPLLVAYPAVHALNFARITPYVDQTVNHLRHEVEGTAYSLIGGGFASPVDDTARMDETAAALVGMAMKTFPQLREASLRSVHWGLKTEWGKRHGLRHYQCVVERIAPKLYAALPGKFSLCFTLAEQVARALGVSDHPGRFPERGKPGDLGQYLSCTRHEAAVLDHLVSLQPVHSSNAGAAA